MFEKVVLLVLCIHVLSVSSECTCQDVAEERKLDVMLGEPLLIPCEALKKGGPPSCDIKWSLNGNQFADQEHGIIRLEDDGSTLFVGMALEQHNRLHAVCTVIGATNCTSTAFLKVRVSQEDASALCQNGGTAVLSGTNDGSPFRQFSCVCADGFRGHYCDFEFADQTAFIIALWVIVISMLCVVGFANYRANHRRRVPPPTNRRAMYEVISEYLGETKGSVQQADPAATNNLAVPAPHGSRTQTVTPTAPATTAATGRSPMMTAPRLKLSPPKQQSVRPKGAGSSVVTGPPKSNSPMISGVTVPPKSKTPQQTSSAATPRPRLAATPRLAVTPSRAHTSFAATPRSIVSHSAGNVKAPVKDKKSTAK